MQINNVTVLLVTPIAPSIAGLTNITAIAGTSPTLSPVVTGVPPPAYQWYVSTDGGATSNALSYATGSSLTLTNVQYSQNNYIYSLVATNSLGTNAKAKQSGALGHCTVTPSITGFETTRVSLNLGDTVIISPTVGGIPTPTFQWQTNGVNLADGPDANGSTIAGSSTSTLYITNAQVADSVTYSLVASNSAGSVTNSMSLTVAAGSLFPAITGPSNTTVIQGGNATFSASAAGVPVPTLQWLDQNQAPITGATNSTLTLSNVLYSQNGFVYSIVASNSVGSATNSATLTVIVPPAISSQPVSVVVTNTQTASFTVGASGVPAVAYQWYKNGSPISSAANNTATNATFTIASVSPGDTSTNYSCVITNLAGTTNTVAVSLTVNSVALTAAGFSPANGQTGVCYDTPLYITFSQTPTLRTAGKIRIYNVTNSTTPVDTIDLGQCSTANATYAANIQAYSFSGDICITNYPGNHHRHRRVSGAIYPHHDLLTSNQTYYVTLDDGTFADSTGAYFAGIAATNVWQFTTKLTGPAITTNLVVAADGSGDFLTVQGAVDSVPANNTTPTIYSTYLRTASTPRRLTSNPRTTWISAGKAAPAPMSVIRITTGSTAMALRCARCSFPTGNDCSFENLTITNTTCRLRRRFGAGGGHGAIVEGTRAIFCNMELDSYQDTFFGLIPLWQAGVFPELPDLRPDRFQLGLRHGLLYQLRNPVRSFRRPCHATGEVRLYHQRLRFYQLPHHPRAIPVPVLSIWAAPSALPPRPRKFCFITVSWRMSSPVTRVMRAPTWVTMRAAT